MTVILIWVFFSIVALAEIPPMIAKGLWRELVVFSALTVLSATLLTLVVLRIPMPPISTLMLKAFKQLIQR